MTQIEFDRLFKPTTPNVAFDNWMNQVDAYIQKRTGLVSADLADYCYMDAFEDDATPRQAAVDAIHSQD